MLGRAVRKVHDEVKRSARPELPIFWSEYNASYKNEPEVTDATFMGPWLANTIRQSDGLTDMLSYWTMSDVFEEQGVVKEPFYGGYGLIAEGGVPKPSFNAFKLLHRLGTRRVETNSSSALVTHREDGRWVVAVWNLAQPGEQGTSKEVAVTIKGSRGGNRATVARVDAAHGSPLPAYEAMGRPVSPTPDQLRALRLGADTVPPHGLALVEVQ
jgi:xylan 1,4-beta-xylosidase